MSEPPIFVFGSNLAGRHGKGAALFARQERGAIQGVGSGPQGHSYAIPTKGYGLEVLPLVVIADAVAGFIAYARDHPHSRFEVTAIGTGLAGYTPREIAPMFADAPPNCELPPTFRDVIGDR
jgi:hypothetical protein